MKRTLIALALMVSSLALGQETFVTRPRIEGPLTLERALEVGLRESLEVSMAQAELRASEAATRLARSQTKPQLSANAFTGTGTMQNILTTPPTVMPPGMMIAPPRAFVNGNLTLMVPIYTGGRLESLVRNARLEERAVAAEVGGVMSETALEIKRMYFEALYRAELAQAEQARVEAAREMARVAQAQFEEGKGIEASVRRAQAELAEAERELTMAQNERAKALLSLKTAMGVDLESPVTLPTALEFDALEQDLTVYLTEASKLRPALLAARARVDAANAMVSAMRARNKPQVYGMAMADVMRTDEMTESGYTLGLTLGFPILDGGERKAEIDQAQAMRRRAEAALAAVELMVANEVRQGWLDVETAAKNYQSALAGLQAAEEAYKVVQVRAEANKAIQVEVLDALSALTRARANIAQALYEHEVAVARLNRAVGRP